MADEDVYVQNRDIGNNTPNYIAGFFAILTTFLMDAKRTLRSVHAKNTVYCGSNVYQKYCNEWRDKIGDVIIDQGTQVELRGADIVFTTGVFVTGGGSLHAHLGYTGNCTEDMSQRNSNDDNSADNGGDAQVNENRSNQELPIKIDNNPSINIYPNPVSENKVLMVEMFHSKEGILYLYDITGKTILTHKIYEGNNELILPHDSKGLYLIKIQNNEKNIFNKKLVVY
jgi:predicted secreted protein